MTELIMLVGVKGCGKTFLAKHYAIARNMVVYGEDQRQDIAKALSQDIGVVYDAENLSCKRRMKFLRSIAHIPCKKKCIVVITTPEDIEERMTQRDCEFSMEVVHKQICQFQCPNYYEGWDAVEIYYNSSIDNCFSSYIKLRSECHIPHDNPHRSLSIIEHLSKAADIAEGLAWKDEDLTLVHERWVALVHDIGKPRCKSFVDSDGAPTEIAHYYGHQNYSAYYSLIIDNSGYYVSEKDRLDNACLIQWHMERCFRKGSALSKFYKMIGLRLEKRLHILEEADKRAH